MHRPTTNPEPDAVTVQSHTRPLNRTRIHGRAFTLRAIASLAAAACAFSGCDANARTDTTELDSVAQFAFAGVIEGFYGTPWSHSDRMDILSFMGETGLDAYVYAPKDDPYHLERWRDPYPTEEAEQLHELIQHASNQSVDFWYAISPGGSMQYSSMNDYQALLAKIDAVAGLGVDHFGLFLDDVPLRLQHDGDRREFSTLGDAHVSLVNRLHTDFESRGFGLMVTPTVYTSAWGNPDYLDALGSGIHPDVLLVWTGPDVVSDSITAEVSADWAARVGRRVVLWDNYPVNDFAPWRVFVGPLRGRAPDLPTSTIGILANPMNQARTSMIALWTLADYAADPTGYDPVESQSAAITYLFGDMASHVQAINDVFGDYASDDHLLQRLYFLRDTIDLTPVDNAFTALDASLDALSASATTNRSEAFSSEVRTVLQRARSRSEALRADSRYGAENGLLVFDSASDIVAVPQGVQTTTIDGSLDDWNKVTWRPLRGRLDARIALRYDDGRLYMAVRARSDGDAASRRVPENAQIQIVIDHDASGNVVTPEDLFLQLTQAGIDDSAEAFVGSMRFEGFMAKWLGDNEALTLTDFHRTTFGTAPSSAMAPVVAGLRHAVAIRQGEFVAEVALPWEGWSKRLSLTTRMSVGGSTATASLAARNYPANPVTYARLRRTSS